MKPQPRYQKGERIGGRYQVHQALMGGMGEVYLCLDLEEMTPYALKTFQQRYLEQASGLRRAFEQEVATWVALEKHPNIVRCFYMDTLDNQPFMRLEWVAGEKGRGVDLRGWLRQGPLGLRQALDFAIDICYGLVHAQQKQPGMVHRDLKPENILIAQGGLAKITDFGLAQMVVQANLEVDGLVMSEGSPAAHPQQSLAAQGGIAGTPPYMPPEQWQPGAVLDERTDIYTLGCILVEMLTGRPPFAVEVRPTTPENYQRWLSAWQCQHESADRPVFPSAIPALLTGLLTSCLARDREARPQSAADLLAGLQQVYRQLLGYAPRPAPVSTVFLFGDYNNRGCTYYTLGLYEEALADFAQAIRLNPAATAAFTNRGNTYHNLGRYEEALADYAQSICLNPAYADAFYNRGNTYHNLGRYEEAFAEYAQAIRLNPTEATTYNNRGVTYQTLGLYEEALADFAQAIRLNPAEATTFYNRGNTYHHLGQYEEALAEYAQAIRLNPIYADAYKNRGNTYDNLGLYEEALAEYAQAIRLNPTEATAYNNRGITYQTLGWYQEALADHAQAVRLNPAEATTFYNLGLAYAALGRYEEALADFAQAIRLSPIFADAYNSRGNTYDALGRSEDALADYAQAIQLNPADALAFYNRGNTYQDLGLYEEALADYAQAIRLNPADAQAYNDRGITYDDLGRYEEALADYAQAIRLNPAYAAAYYNCGALMANTGRLRESLPYFEKAAQLGDSHAAQALGQVRQMLGGPSAPDTDPTQQVFEALQQAASLPAMAQAVAQYPFMARNEFITTIEEVIKQVPSAQQPYFQQRLIWLKHIAREQKL